MTALAAGELYKNKKTAKIIFSGGKTGGENFPSEAAAMRAFMKKAFPEIPDSDIFLEENSKNTQENAEELKKITESFNQKNIAILTVDFHTKRSKEIFERENMKFETLSSENILLDRSEHYKKLIDDFHSSMLVKKEKFVER
jgi:uncharacterized SAM-binding protein YcdF (DUF218 family)